MNSVVDCQASMGPRTSADIIATFPVSYIVAAFRTGAGVIGNLIGRHSMLITNFLSDVKKLCGVVLLGQHKSASPFVSEKWRAFFDCQLIERQMIAGEAKRFFQFVGPRADGLSGAGIYKVKGKTREGLLGKLKGGKGLIAIVSAAQKF